MSHRVEVCGAGYVHGQCRCPSPTKAVVRVDCSLPAGDPHEGYARWEETSSSSTTPPPSSTEPAVGQPLQDLPSRTETREISYSAEVPGYDGQEISSAMRLCQRAVGSRPEQWTVSIPPTLVNTARPFPPCLIVSGRERAETLTKALAIAAAIHAGEVQRSLDRHRLYVQHYAREAGQDAKVVDAL